MNNTTKIIAAIVTLVTLVLQVPGAQEVVGGFFSSHGNISAILAGVTSIWLLIRKPA